MNPIEHVCDFIDRKINQRNPKCQNFGRIKNYYLTDYILIDIFFYINTVKTIK
jgi:hypothetical protein